MSYKVMVVHCDARPTVPLRAGVAAELAQRFGAYLIGLHVRLPFEKPLFLDSGLVMDDFVRIWEEGAKADETTASTAFQEAIKDRNLSAEWRVVTGYPKTVVAAQVRSADLAVLGQDEPEATALMLGLPDAVALTTGRPILVVPYIGAKPPGRAVMLCWNGGREAVRAATDALPLLKAADKVVVLTIHRATAPEREAAELSADAAAWLGWHGVKVTVQHDVAPDDDVGSIILSRAADVGADLIVMGVYGHSRMREMVLGGASRTVLSSMTVPVLMSH